MEMAGSTSASISINSVYKRLGSYSSFFVSRVRLFLRLEIDYYYYYGIGFWR